MVDFIYYIMEEKRKDSINKMGNYLYNIKIFYCLNRVYWEGILGILR